MKTKLTTAAVSLTLSFSLSCSAVMCLVTGFDLTVDSIPGLTWVCFAAALSCSIGFSLERGGPIIVTLTAFGAGYLGIRLLPIQQLAYFAQHISRVYDNAYHWGVLAQTASLQSADFPLMILGCLSALTLSFWLCRGKGLLWALAPVVLMLLSCLVVTNTLPDRQYLFLILAGVSILLLSGPLRQQNIRQSNRLMLMSALPILTALGLLFLLVPQENYVNRSDMVLQHIASLGQAIPNKLETAMSGLIKPAFSQSIDLSALPSHNQSTTPVMTVTAPHTGELYLRGRCYDRYTGTGWVAEDDPSKRILSQQAEDPRITVRTRRVQEVLYVPCYPTQPVCLEGSWLPNPEGLQEYGFSADTSGRQVSPLTEESRFLSLPETANNEAQALLEIIGRDSSAIAEFVRSSAVYDKKPEIFPKEEADFAAWFLKEADRGYCVHFATATVVLLRAAGIPARYVTGFLAYTEAEKPIILTAENAHAWAEYYDRQQNTWRILEATPTDYSPIPSETVANAIHGTEAPAPQPHIQHTQSEPMQPPAAMPHQPHSAATEPAWIFCLATIYFGWAVLAIQRCVRLILRTRTQNRGSSNQQAMARWKEAEFLSRLLKQPPTEEILALTYKARFSQHQLTNAELEQFDSYLRSCRQQLGRKRWHIRFVHKYLFAAY